MANARPVQGTATAESGRTTAAADRRRSAHDKVAPRPQERRSDLDILAAEVERLEQELGAAREQMAALQACVDLDPLTGLFNRRAFTRELGRALAYVKRHGTAIQILYLDLDRFKRVNDEHGHAAGDQVLCAIATVLRRHVRQSDLVARIGGDEFAMLLWNCTEAGAEAKAVALEEAIGRTTASHAGSLLGASASVGVARLLPLDRAEETLSRADAAMYARKRGLRPPAAAE